MFQRRIGWTHTGTAAVILMVATTAPEPLDIIPANPTPDSISDNAMSFNAMSFNALMMHPNEELADYSLAQVVAPGSVFEQDLFMDPYAREFMHYLVSCAMEEGEELAWSSGGKNEVWSGSLGLCPSWETSVPSEACQELVSACLLARTNAYGQTVPISLRGVHTNNVTPLPLGPDEKLDFPWQEGAFFGNVFCEDCIDPSLEMFFSSGRLTYRLRDEREPERYVDVACEPLDIRSEEEVLRLRNECHARFLEMTRYAGVVYRAMFACWSPVWADGKAYTLKRICAGAASEDGIVADQKQCAAWPVGACTMPSAQVPCQTKDICDVGDNAVQPKDGDVDDCSAMPQATSELPEPGTCPAPPPLTAPTWHHPLTVFLHEPCAIVPERDGCRLNPEIIDPTTGGPRWPILENNQR